MDYDTLLRELMQLQVLDDERATRIYHLEQALDQALLCIEELRIQLRDQRMLESQLAATEDFASIQQQAIARLRLQIDQQQRLIEEITTQQADVNDQHALLQEMMGMLTAIAAQQEQEMTLLQTCQETRTSEMETHACRLEAETIRLQNNLDQHQRRLLALEAEILTAHAQQVQLQAELDRAIQSRRSPLESGFSPSPETPAASSESHLPLPEGGPLPRSALSPSRFSIPLTGSQDLAKLQVQVEELELQLSKQMATQARWQQRCLELEAEVNQHQTQTAENQQQIVEMQEEILRQTKQAGEYEATIQHWKERHLQNQRNLMQLQELLERVLPYPLSDPETEVDLNPALGELLAAIQATLMPEDEDELSSNAVPAPHFNTLDLPDFLIRRRNYRKTIK
jgi:chromosome segregation ATPase